MKKETILYGIIGLLGGIVIAGFASAYAVNNDHGGMMKIMGMGNHRDRDTGLMSGSSDTIHGGMGMDDMTAALKGKTGDDFDKAFIEQMIDHHQGAIDMANLAIQNAKHKEIKELADDITSAQSREIDMMQSWQSDWGYKSVPRSHMMQ